MTTFISFFSMKSFLAILLKKHFCFDKETQKIALDEFNKIHSKTDFTNFVFWADINDELESFSYFFNSLLISLAVIIWSAFITSCIGMEKSFQIIICLFAILVANQMYSCYKLNCDINFDRQILKLAKSKLAYELRKEELYE